MRLLLVILFLSGPLEVVVARDDVFFDAEVFDTEIASVLERNCVGCHNADDRKGGH